MPDDPKPQPIDWQKYSWLATPASIVLAAVIILAGPRYLPSVDPTPGPLPPAPVVIEPTKFDYDRSFVLKDGKVLPKADAKPIIDAVNNGNAVYTVRGFIEGKAEETRTVTISGGLVPVPPGPIPPDPPGPNPPEPAPMPSDGFRVLFVYETNPTSPEAILPKEQQAALFSPAVAAYLDAKCPKGLNGTPEWRRYDQHQDVSKDGKVWQEAMKLPRNVIPWVVISDGKQGYSGPLPENEAALLALLKRYGGA